MHGSSGCYMSIWLKLGAQIVKYVNEKCNVWGNILAMSVNVTVIDGKIPTPSQYDDYAVSMNSTVRFDTDSCPIKIGNCCTQIISGYKEVFLPGTLRNVDCLVVKGFVNTRTAITHQYTIAWNIVDDDGKLQQITISNSYFVPGCEVRLLSPQRWAQVTADHFPVKDGTWCATYNDRIELF
jgi:hypothetical protein